MVTAAIYGATVSPKGAERWHPYGGESTVLINNLPANLSTKAELSQTCAKFGQIINVRWVTAETAKTRKAHAYVMFADSTAAQTAIEELARVGAQPTIARNYRMNGEDIARAKELGVAVNGGVLGEQPPGGSTAGDMGNPLAAPVLAVAFASADGQPCNQIAISGLPSSMQQASLVSLLAGLGFTVLRSAVQVDIRNPKFATASVEVQSAEEAAMAIQYLNGQPFAGFCAVSTEVSTTPTLGAPPPAQHSLGMQGIEASFRIRYAGNAQIPSDCAYITGLPASIDEATLRAMFHGAGLNLVRLRLCPKVESRPSEQRVAIVGFGSREEAALAIAAYSPNNAAILLGHSANDRPVLLPELAQIEAPIQPEMTANYTLQVKFAGKDRKPGDNLYVTGLPMDLDLPIVVDMFAHLGFAVKRARGIANTKNFAYNTCLIQVSSIEEAERAIKTMNGQVCENLLMAAAIAVLPPPTPTPTPPTPASGDNTSWHEATWQESSTGWWQDGAAGWWQPGKGGGKVEATWQEALQMPLAPLPPPSWPPQQAGNLNNPTGALVVKYAGAGSPGPNLYIMGLPSPSVDQAQLNALFNSKGFKMLRQRVLPDTRNVGRSGAMVQLESQEMAAQAITELNGKYFSTEIAQVW